MGNHFLFWVSPQTNGEPKGVNKKMLAKLLSEGRRVVVLTGAGMSTESGLQDFRSADRGMWNDMNPLDIADIDFFQGGSENLAMFQKFYTWRIDEMYSHLPNSGHNILAKWETQGLIQGIITQNVDSYHELAGTKILAKLHGDLATCVCTQCGHKYPNSGRLLNPSGRGWVCYKGEPFCNGIIRPNVVLFGEELPAPAVALADQLISQAGVLLVLGTSLRVSPANSYVNTAKENGAKVIIVNKERTLRDYIADAVIRESIGKVLADIDSML